MDLPRPEVGPVRLREAVVAEVLTEAAANDRARISRVGEPEPRRNIVLVRVTMAVEPWLHYDVLGEHPGAHVVADAEVQRQLA
jgi:hypothetical protein